MTLCDLATFIQIRIYINIRMSALENSFTSERDSPTKVSRHPLNLDLQQLDAKFENEQHDQSKPNTQSQSGQDNLTLSLNCNNSLENQPQLQLANKSRQSSDEPPCQEQQQNQSPRTITLIQDEIVSKESMNASQRYSQYSLQVDNQSFATFLSIKDSSYDTVVKSFQLLFENVSNLFGQRVKHIKKTYLSLLKMKQNQQKAYVKANLSHIKNSKNHIIYINCKNLTEQIRNNIQSQKQSKKQFINLSQQIISKLQKHLQEIVLQVKQKSSRIKQVHNKIIQFGSEMNELMIPSSRKAKKSSINSQIYSSSFIRTKYLMGKEKSYLSFISVYLQKIINFINFICFDVQPKNCLIVKQSMLSFVQVWCAMNPKMREPLTQKIQILYKTNCYNQVYKQVSKMLQICIPSSISSHNFSNEQKQYGQKQLKRIIQAIISESQSLIYIPVIELQDKDYVYHSKDKAEVKWIRVNHQQKYPSQTIQELPAYVILTRQGHLILQLIQADNKTEQKMAILKLSSIKISRKGNQLILTDRAQGMIGYLFSTNIILGSLIFQPLKQPQHERVQRAQDDLIQQFTLKIRQILDLRKINKDKKNTSFQ